MANETIEWPGATGKKYPYHIHGIDFDPSPKQDGNYILAKIANGKWQPIYIGEGDLKTRIAAAKSDGCVLRKGATHIHEHLNGNETARKAEESDILAVHPVAYAPTGCNVKTGG
jgi:hypothetical protein